MAEFNMSGLYLTSNGRYLDKNRKEVGTIKDGLNPEAWKHLNRHGDGYAANVNRQMKAGNIYQNGRWRAFDHTTGWKTSTWSEAMQHRAANMKVNNIRNIQGKDTFYDNDSGGWYAYSDGKLMDSAGNNQTQANNSIDGPRIWENMQNANDWYKNGTEFWNGYQDFQLYLKNGGGFKKMKLIKKQKYNIGGGINPYQVHPRESISDYRPQIPIQPIIKGKYFVTEPYTQGSHTMQEAGIKGNNSETRVFRSIYVNPTNKSEKITYYPNTEESKQLFEEALRDQRRKSLFKTK